MRSNAAKFRAGFEAVNRRDIDAVLDLLDPEIEWNLSAAFPDLPVYHGHAGVRHFFEDVFKLWDEWRIEIDEIHEQGDYVLVLGSWSGKGKGSAVPVRDTGGWFWRLKDRKGVLMRFYANPSEAVRAMERALAQEAGGDAGGGRFQVARRRPAERSRT
jgi:ketosteroid isomerase-like protein